MLIPRVTLRSLSPLNEVNGQNQEKLRRASLRPATEYTETLLERALASARGFPADRGLAHEVVFRRHPLAGHAGLAHRPQNAGPHPETRLCRICYGSDSIDFLARPHPRSRRRPRNRRTGQTRWLARKRASSTPSCAVTCARRTRNVPPACSLMVKPSQPALGYSHPEWLVTRWQNNSALNAPAKTARKPTTRRPRPTRASDEHLRTDATKLIEALVQ